LPPGYNLTVKYPPGSFFLCLNILAARVMLYTVPSRRRFEILREETLTLPKLDTS
jgi:hypothetical protein